MPVDIHATRVCTMVDLCRKLQGEKSTSGNILTKLPGQQISIALPVESNILPHKKWMRSTYWTSRRHNQLSKAKVKLIYPIISSKEFLTTIVMEALANLDSLASYPETKSQQHIHSSYLFIQM